MTSSRILILAPESDVHAIAVAQEVRTLGGSADILDTALFPLSAVASVSIRPGVTPDFAIRAGREPGGTYDGVWVRRPRPPRVCPDYQVDVRKFAQASSQALLYGGLFGTASVVINAPTINSAIKHKPFQLVLAANCGLRVPETLVTNSPSDAQAFVASRSKTIYKTVTTWFFDLKETRLVREGDMAELRGISDCPVIFQELVSGTKDIRVTVVGKRVFAAEIDLPMDDPAFVDGRFGDREYRPHDLPQFVERKLLDFHAKSGLTYGAYDFRLSLDGEYVFLEVNPEGQFLFVEIDTGHPISREVAVVLCGLA